MPKVARLKKSLVIFFIIFPIIILGFFLFFDKSISYQIEVYSKKIAINKINTELNRVIINEIENSEITYDYLIKSEKDSEGRISAVKTDMMAVNLLKNRLDIAVSDVCSEATVYNSEIPLGSLLGNGLMYCTGVDIPIRFRPVGSAVTNMAGEFIESGINQTLYRIAFTVDADIVIVFPFKYIEAPIRIETVIAETVIVGTVPESFTHFDLNGDITSQDFQGYVEDYMAE